MGEWDDAYNIVGFAGGVILAAALLPQIYLAHRRKSTEDISYVWQAVYTVGLITLMVYYPHHRLWPVFYPMTFEFTCLMYLTGLKIYFDVVVKRRNDRKIDDDAEFSRPKLQRRMSSKLAFDALANDVSRGSRIGRMPSKLNLGEQSNASRTRMGASATSSLGDTSVRSKPSLFRPALHEEEQTQDADFVAGNGSGTDPVVVGDEQV